MAAAASLLLLTFLTAGIVAKYGCEIERLLRNIVTKKSLKTYGKKAQMNICAI